ncbi:hypothetical protein AMECASPLE_028674 [Ameca splendens]|uniref:Uncharacterized protein n=1 Tax=Ameca splendens TaxID=208324 RepID=A0ABV0Z499_9TELE
MKSKLNFHPTEQRRMSFTHLPVCLRKLSKKAAETYDCACALSVPPPTNNGSEFSARTRFGRQDDSAPPISLAPLVPPMSCLIGQQEFCVTAAYSLVGCTEFAGRKNPRI